MSRQCQIIKDSHCFLSVSVVILSQTGNEEFISAAGILVIFIYNNVSQNLVPGPVASASPGNLLQTQILKLPSRPQEPSEDGAHKSRLLRALWVIVRMHTAGQEKELTTAARLGDFFN